MIAEALEARPRGTGEILDDAWRLALADLPFLLGLSGLFVLPAAIALLLLFTQPAATAAWAKALWPALAVFFVALTGLGSGAAQEALHCWGEGHQPSFRECLAAALRRGLNHVTVQALLLALPCTALASLVMPGWLPIVRVAAALFCLLLSVPVWLLSLSWHTGLAAGMNNLWKVGRLSSRASGRQPLKVWVLVLMRGVFLLFAILNLHLFGQFALWAAESLGGFEVAFLSLLCSLSSPAYLFALTALAWWLLTPFQQAVSYLFYIDSRTRHEGLDLWFRVEDLFPIRQATQSQSDVGWMKPTLGDRWVPKTAPTLLLLLALVLPASTVEAGDRVGSIQTARKQIRAIHGEIDRAKPYAGGEPWTGRLRDVGAQLARGGSKGGFHWYERALAGFEGLSKDKAQGVLDRIDTRLALIEESLRRPEEAGGMSKADIKALVPPDTRGQPEKKAPKRVDETTRKKEEPIKRDDELFGDGGPARRGGGVVGPVGLGGAANVLMYLCGGVLVVVVVLAIALFVRQWLASRAKRVPRQAGVTEPEPDDFLAEPDRQDVQSLWRQADELARAGKFLAAVRTLYLSVLALLHQASLIRYERTRTNGEYADQLRPRQTLHRPFVNLTGLFELKWYGERDCRPDDYQACRGLAEEIRGGLAT